MSCQVNAMRTVQSTGGICLNPTGGIKGARQEPSELTPNEIEELQWRWGAGSKPFQNLLAEELSCADIQGLQDCYAAVGFIMGPTWSRKYNMWQVIAMQNTRVGKANMITHRSGNLARFFDIKGIMVDFENHYKWDFGLDPDSLCSICGAVLDGECPNPTCGRVSRVDEPSILPPKTVEESRALYDALSSATPDGAQMIVKKTGTGHRKQIQLGVRAGSLYCVLPAGNGISLDGSGWDDLPPDTVRKWTRRRPQGLPRDHKRLLAYDALSHAEDAIYQAQRSMIRAATEGEMVFERATDKCYAIKPRYADPTSNKPQDVTEFAMPITFAGYEDLDLFYAEWPSKQVDGEEYLDCAVWDARTGTRVGRYDYGRPNRDMAIAEAQSMLDDWKRHHKNVQAHIFDSTRLLLPSHRIIPDANRRVKQAPNNSRRK